MRRHAQQPLTPQKAERLPTSSTRAPSLLASVESQKIAQATPHEVHEGICRQHNEMTSYSADCTVVVSETSTCDGTHPEGKAFTAPVLLSRPPPAAVRSAVTSAGQDENALRMTSLARKATPYEMALASLLTNRSGSTLRCAPGGGDDVNAQQTKRQEALHRRRSLIARFTRPATVAIDGLLLAPSSRPPARRSGSTDVSAPVRRLSQASTPSQTNSSSDVVKEKTSSDLPLRAPHILHIQRPASCSPPTSTSSKKVTERSSRVPVVEKSSHGRRSASTQSTAPTSAWLDAPDVVAVIEIDDENRKAGISSSTAAQVERTNGPSAALRHFVTTSEHVGQHHSEATLSSCLTSRRASSSAKPTNDSTTYSSSSVVAADVPQRIASSSQNLKEPEPSSCALHLGSATSQLQSPPLVAPSYCCEYFQLLEALRQPRPLVVSDCVPRYYASRGPPSSCGPAVPSVARPQSLPTDELLAIRALPPAIPLSTPVRTLFRDIALRAETSALLCDPAAAPPSGQLNTSEEIVAAAKYHVPKSLFDEAVRARTLRRCMRHWHHAALHEVHVRSKAASLLRLCFSRWCRCERQRRDAQAADDVFVRRILMKWRRQADARRAAKPSHSSATERRTQPSEGRLTRQPSPPRSSPSQQHVMHVDYEVFYGRPLEEAARRASICAAALMMRYWQQWSAAALFSTSDAAHHGALLRIAKKFLRRKLLAKCWHVWRTDSSQRRVHALQEDIRRLSRRSIPSQNHISAVTPSSFLGPVSQWCPQ